MNTRAILSAALLFAAGCALTSRSEPMRVRYYTLESGNTQQSLASQPRSTPLELRIGRIDASGYLNQQIAFRNSSHQLEFYDDLRWTEKPEQYLRRALTKALFQERGLTRSYSGMTPTLDIELVEFEEIRGAEPKVRLQALVTLHDERRSQLEETVTVERPISGADPSGNHTEATAAALAEALNAAVAGVADKVIARLDQTQSDPQSQAAQADAGAANPVR